MTRFQKIQKWSGVIPFVSTIFVAIATIVELKRTKAPRQVWRYFWIYAVSSVLVAYGMVRQYGLEQETPVVGILLAWLTLAVTNILFVECQLKRMQQKTFPKLERLGSGDRTTKPKKPSFLSAAGMILAVLSVAVLLVLPFFLPNPYRFPNRDMEIVRIELLQEPDIDAYNAGGDDVRLLAVLEGETAAEFMEELYQLETHAVTPPPTGYNGYIAQIIYANGDVELLGSRYFELVEAGETRHMIGGHRFSSRDAFEDLLLEYAEKYSFPESKPEERNGML